MKPTVKGLFWALFLVSFTLVQAQDIAVTYSLGEKYSDRHKYSTVLNISDDTNGKTILVRKYFGGVVLHPKGYFIEVYNKDLELIGDYNYKYNTKHMVDGFVKNGQLYLLELVYSDRNEAYEYRVHQSPLDDFNFTEKTVLSIPSKEVERPLALSKYNRSFGNGFSTAVFFNETKNAFAITVQHRERKKELFSVYLFGTDLKQKIFYDLTNQTTDKNYAFETITVSKDLSTLYLMGKAFFKKRRVTAKERRFKYELLRITNNGHISQDFVEPGRFPESLKPVLMQDKLIAIGFYADRKDNRYNGLAYFKLDAQNLSVVSKKFNAFSKDFMLDKFGREDSKEIKNLIFKNVHITPSNAIIFSAEEYFVTAGKNQSASGTNTKIERYHYNDIICAKLTEDGTMQWARNINKSEVTQGDAAYASYTAFGMGSDMYFFMNSGENPQQLSKNRILFKQGYSRNPNMFVVRLNTDGELDYTKLIDDKEVRLPIMVSKPLVNRTDNEILFYAKRGNKKQLIKVSL